MKTKNTFARWIIGTLSFCLLDSLWIGVIMNNFYKNEAGALMKSSLGLIDYLAAFGVWGLMSFGLLYFVIPRSKNIKEVIINSLLIGLVIYGVYDLTNQAIINGWSWNLVIIDIFWGMLLNATSALIILFVTKRP